MNEEDKPKTAFVTPIGFWEFNRMPQGVTNAPSTFQRLMERCMGDLHLKEVLVFLDDIIIFSDTLEEHERRLLQVLTRLRDYGLKLSPEKCLFFQSSVKYLGHIVSEKGVETDPGKIEALKSWPIPTNLRELRSFLGFAGYYRRFIKDYASFTKPLNDLTKGYAPARKSAKGRKLSTTYLSAKEPFGERWTVDCQKAFEVLIDKLTSAPVLGFANPKLPYILHTDASTTGLGAALYQEQDGQLRVIAYASRGLSHSESRYPAHKLEFLALKWSVVEKFHDYLYGANFTVVTDSNPLTYVLTSARLDATSHRWLAALSAYSFKLQYRAGRHNHDADGLSRRPHSCPDDDLSQKEQGLIQQFLEQRVAKTEDEEELSPEIVNTICETSLQRRSSADVDHLQVTLAESLSLHAQAIPDCFSSEDLHGLPELPELSQTDLRDRQQADPAIREVVRQLETGESVAPILRKEFPELPLLLRELPKLEMRDGVLFRRRMEDGHANLQLVLPPDLRFSVLTSLHDHMGHMGVERTLDLTRQRFFWPRMAADVEKKIRTCGRCVRRKSAPEKAAPLVSIKTTRPLELLCMDFLSIEPDSSNTKDVLVLTDHFTKFAMAIPTPNQKARTVARCLWNDFIANFGVPERLHTDQGPDFESKLIRELCELTGMKKSHTTPYHPRGNPVERFNRTLLNMLGTLDQKQKTKWREYVKPLVHAYNCTRNEVTGFTPYELMFGRTPRLPVDLAFGLPVRDKPATSHTEYVKNLKTRLEESYELASRNALKSSERNKARFDRRVTPCKLEVGDRVLIRNVRIRGKHKLEDKWEPEVYVVIKCAGDLPVYTVKPESKDGPTRTLHRDLLLPCGFLPAVTHRESSPPAPAQRPQTRSQPLPEPADVYSSEDEEILFFRPPVPAKSSESSVCSPRNLVPEPATISFSPLPIEPAVGRVQTTQELPVESPPEISQAPETVCPLENAQPVVPAESAAEDENLPESIGQPEDPSESQSNVPVEEVAEEMLPVAEDQPELSVDPEPVSSDPDLSGIAVESASPNHIATTPEIADDVTLRRSGRQRVPPNRLRYSKLDASAASETLTGPCISHKLMESARFWYGLFFCHLLLLTKGPATQLRPVDL
ncbi:hypothetical protein WMY93_020199 [Mugilogobius chulae]|uniref:Gypsy retrotransposon integrase-like protein 1 n=1 Tax=Mugilogobius chulae TaxID=88201 RepID=A0AAW0NNA6_9GOBI